MILPLTIRRLQNEDEIIAIALIQNVFMEFVAPAFSREGIDEFMRHAKIEAFRKRQMENCFALVAEMNGTIVGVTEIKDHSHIAFMFVDKKFQRKGICRKLIEAAVSECLKTNPKLEIMTVNSSPNATPAYSRLGFEPTDSQQTKNGIVFTPMAYKFSKTISENTEMK